MKRRFFSAAVILIIGVSLVSCDKIFPSGEAVGSDVRYYVETTNTGTARVLIRFVDAGGERPTAHNLGLGTAWIGDLVRKKGQLVGLRAWFEQTTRTDTVKVYIAIDDEIFASDMCWTPGCEAAASGIVP
jgi:hypothetical protein